MSDSINRLGIALNFAAGLLLAPQLIGERRLATFERWATAMAAELADAVRGRFERAERLGLLPRRRISHNDPAPFSAAALELISSALLWLALVMLTRLVRKGEVALDEFWVVWPVWAPWPDALIVCAVCLVMTLIVALSGAINQIAHGPHGNPGREWWTAVNVLMKAAAFPVAFPFLLWQVLELGAARLLGVAARLLGAFAEALQRRPWVSGGLTTLGLILFTVGNSLQFVGSY